jgi:GntR family transcriptional regulator/MocR family aminotransferase
MKVLNLKLLSPNKSKASALADTFRNAIKGGVLRPADVLPSSRELATKYKMSRHTVMNALQTLQSEGWIEAHEKKHYAVTTTLPDKFLIPEVNNSAGQSKQINISIPNKIDIADYVPDRHYKHAFLSGFPDIRLFPMTSFKSSLYDNLMKTERLDYGDPKGLPELRSEVGAYLRRVRGVKDRDIVITNGSQEAIFLLSQIFLQDGDCVAVEALGYPPAIEAIKFSGARIVPIAIDSEGMVMEDLEQKIKKHKIKMIYTTPLHQYPTTITLNAARRLKLYEIAVKHKIVILEDDYDHEFHYNTTPVAPLASFDPAGIICYISTFSKILFPSARVGFMAVPETVAREVAKLKRITSRQNEHLTQGAIAQWMKNGEFEKHLRKMRRIYHERKDSIMEDLNHFRKNKEISWIEPEGGMALWMNINQNSTVIAKKALERSIFVAPESKFVLDGKVGTHLRLGFTGQTPEENREGIKELFKLL